MWNRAPKLAARQLKGSLRGDCDNHVINLIHEEQHQNEIKNSQEENEKYKVSNDPLKPVAESHVKMYIGDYLVRCLNECRNRCKNMMGQISDLLEQERQMFPRLYLCSNEDLLNIILSCYNIRFSLDDFRPIFPSISKLHVSTTDAERIVGMSNTRGEMYAFSNDFPAKGNTVSNLLSKVEVEMKNAVKASINEAASSRDYTDFQKWYTKYPLRACVILNGTF